MYPSAWKGRSANFATCMPRLREPRSLTLDYSRRDIRYFGPMCPILACGTMVTSERKRGSEVIPYLRPPIEEEEPMMAQVATEQHNGVVVNSTVDVHGETLVINVIKRDEASVFTPTMKIPLALVLSAETD